MLHTFSSWSRRGANRRMLRHHAATQTAASCWHLRDLSAAQFPFSLYPQPLNKAQCTPSVNCQRQSTDCAEAPLTDCDHRPC